MRVLSTQIGLVISWVRAPAASEAAKKSAGVRRWRTWAGERGSGSGAWRAAARRWASPRSRRALKKKKAAQLVALPSRFGVRPR
jgi:hypothetical protein